MGLLPDEGKGHQFDTGAQMQTSFLVAIGHQNVLGQGPLFFIHLGEKPYNRTKSPEHRKSPPAISHSPVRQKPSNRTRSQKHKKSRSPPPLSPPKEKPSSRTRSPKRVKSRSSVSQSPEKGKPPIRIRSPRRVRSRSPDSPSLSPRSKRLKRVRAERDAEKENEREHGKNHVRKGDRVTHEEKDLSRDLTIERKDRRANGMQLEMVLDRGTDAQIHLLIVITEVNEDQDRLLLLIIEDVTRCLLTNSRDSEHRNGDSDSIAKMKAVEETLDAKEKQKPSFELSGKLAAKQIESKVLSEDQLHRLSEACKLFGIQSAVTCILVVEVLSGVTLLFNEPPDARKPDIRWRLYVFKGGEVLNEPLYVHRQSCYLFGRERRVADIPTDHPSCSKQHAVLQYRLVEEENADGTMSKRDNQIEPQRYYELFEKDTIKFGNSSLASELVLRLPKDILLGSQSQGKSLNLDQKNRENLVEASKQLAMTRGGGGGGGDGLQIERGDVFLFLLELSFLDSLVLLCVFRC
ncbi:hypothetical protein DH2020_033376 [Rehmannia glutinosa]|uniref:FHA domain-containing protein n=1 Tax=Rehmannia glutinosa TaxID=99300 RepID=A0ABR0VFI5_REHGL